MTDVSLVRLYLLRAMYALMFFGLLATQWPRLLQFSKFDNLWNGVGTAMLCALCLMAGLGLRYPMKMLPVLLFELLWKAAFLLGIAWPASRAGLMTDAIKQTSTECAMAGIILVVVPWGYVWREYVRAPGERWR